MLDKIYGRYRELRKNMRQADDKAHFESMANNNDGGQRLQREERILQESIKSANMGAREVYVLCGDI